MSLPRCSGMRTRVGSVASWCPVACARPRAAAGALAPRDPMSSPVCLVGGRVQLGPGDSLFDGHRVEGGLAENLAYMSRTYGFFVPFVEHVTVPTRPHSPPPSPSPLPSAPPRA